MSSGRRFESLTDEDLEKLIESKDSNNTKQVVTTSVRLLEEYLSVKDNLGVKTVTEMDTASEQLWPWHTKVSVVMVVEFV